MGGGPTSARARAQELRAKVEEKGTLLASGLIAGEAIMGILLAVTFLSGISSFTKLLTGADEFSFFPALGRMAVAGRVRGGGVGADSNSDETGEGMKTGQPLPHGRGSVTADCAYRAATVTER